MPSPTAMGKHVSVHSEILRAWGGSRGFGTTDVGVQGQGKRENTTAQGIAMSSRGSSIRSVPEALGRRC